MADGTGNSEGTRFQITVTDEPTSHSGGFGVFIIPQGREEEWMFSTVEGRRGLCKACGKERLAVIRLFRGQNYQGLEQLKTELNGFIKDFAPDDAHQTIPYLTIGDGEDIGWRNIVEEGRSELSGGYVVEDVRIGNDFFRRLIFLGAATTIQSDVGITPSQPYSWDSVVVNYDALASEYHHGFLAAIGMSARGQASSSKESNHEPIGKIPINCLILGLGGGIFASFVKKWLLNVKLTAVELDPVVVNIAKKYFHLSEDERLRIVVGDAIQYCQSSQEAGSFDTIIVDLATPSPDGGVTAPIPQMLNSAVLESLKRICKPSGCIAINVVSRNEKRKEDIKTLIASHFTETRSYSCNEDLNQVLLCFPQSLKSPTELQKGSKVMAEYLRGRLANNSRTEKRPRNSKNSSKKKKKEIGSTENKEYSGIEDIIEELNSLKL